jgi:hypothetical protein
MANSFIATRKEVELRGYFMRHKTGGDVGFSWKKDDPKFSDQWERIAAVPESPSSATTAGERQSIADDAEFQELAGELWSAGSYNESMEKPLNALIAYLDDSAARSTNKAASLLKEARAALETWKDVAPAVSLCADIDRFFAAPAPGNTAQPSGKEE